jgi:hypothetical protein
LLDQLNKGLSVVGHRLLFQVRVRSEPYQKIDGGPPSGKPSYTTTWDTLPQIGRSRTPGQPQKLTRTGLFELRPIWEVTERKFDIGIIYDFADFRK